MLIVICSFLLVCIFYIKKSSIIFASSVDNSNWLISYPEWKTVVQDIKLTVFRISPNNQMDRIVYSINYEYISAIGAIIASLHEMWLSFYNEFFAATPLIIVTCLKKNFDLSIYESSFCIYINEGYKIIVMDPFEFFWYSSNLWLLNKKSIIIVLQPDAVATVEGQEFLQEWATFKNNPDVTGSTCRLAHDMFTLTFRDYLYAGTEIGELILW